MGGGGQRRSLGGDPVIRPPVHMVTGNLVAATSLEDIWAVYRVPCRSYDAEPLRQRSAMVNALRDYAVDVTADFQILRVGRQWDADAYTEQLWSRTPAGAHEILWRDYLLRQATALEGLRSWSPQTFICVRLAEPAKDLAATARTLGDHGSPVEMVRRWRRRTAARRIGAIDFPDVVAKAEAAERTLRDHFPAAEPASRDDLQWLIRRAFCRGVGEPEVTASTDGTLGDAEALTQHWLDEDLVTAHHRYLIAESDDLEGEQDRQSFQAALYLGAVDDADEFTRHAELMFGPLADLTMPVDASLNVCWVDNTQAVAFADRQVNRVHFQVEDEASKAAGASYDSHEAADRAKERLAYLKRTGYPLVRGSLCLIASGASKTELAASVRAVQAAYAPLRVYQARGVGLQRAGWIQHFPGQLSPESYRRYWTVEQVGAMVPTATQEAGSPTPDAMYIGRTRRGRTPIRLDQREGASTDRTPTIELLGAQGGGKTFTEQLLEYHAFIRGHRIFIMDPKGDHRFHELPEVAPYCRTIILGDREQYRGMLDPFRIAPEGEVGDAAATYFLEILGHGQDRRGDEARIAAGVTATIAAHQDRACGWALVEALRGGTSDEKALGDDLARLATAGIAKLGFARLEDPLPTITESQVTYLQTTALKRPEANVPSSEMTQAQRHGRAVTRLLALYAMRTLGGDRAVPKLLCFDEASFLGADAAGRQLLDQILRWLRAFNATAVLSSQLPIDTAGQAGLKGHRFVFKLEDIDDARETLRSMGQDPDGPLLEAITEQYAKGLGLYQDLWRRHAEVQIDPCWPYLLEMLGTRPPDTVIATPSTTLRAVG